MVVLKLKTDAIHVENNTVIIDYRELWRYLEELLNQYICGQLDGTFTIKEKELVMILQFDEDKWTLNVISDKSGIHLAFHKDEIIKLGISKRFEYDVTGHFLEKRIHILAR